MKPNLYQFLRSLRDRKRGITPDAAWVLNTRETLLMQVRNSMPTPDMASQFGFVALTQMYQRLVQRVRGTVLAVMSVIGVVLGGSIASVSAAEQSLPGDTLYSVKLVTEQARLAFAGTTDKIKLKAAFTMRRVEELQAVIIADTDTTEKNERASMAADGLKRDLDTLKQQMEDVSSDDVSQSDTVDAAKTVDKHAMEVVKALAETKDTVSPEVKVKVIAAQAQAADVGIQALQALVAARQDQGESAVSSEDMDASFAAHTEAAAQVVASAKALATITPATSSTAASLLLVSGSGTSTTSLQLAQSAEQLLSTVQQLAGEERLDEAMGALKDATQKSHIAQFQAEQDALTLSVVSSTAAVLTPSSATSSVRLPTTTTTHQGSSTGTGQ